jgi:MFS superfamily sulfate permease-like transporter
MTISDIKYQGHIAIFSELAGSVGNLGTVLPLFFAISIACGMNLSLMIIWAAIWYWINAIYYRFPISIEPLKAIGAIAIANHLSPQQIAAGGILVGIICLILGVFGGMARIKAYIPEAVIRGVQLGLAFTLLKSATTEFILPDISFAAVSACILCIFLITAKMTKIPDLSALCIMVAGFLLAIYYAGPPVIGDLPLPYLVIPDPGDFITGAILLLPPQIPLTLTNSILATSLLVTDLFGKEENPDRLSRTVGLMSLSASISGGFPMCHGAGGLAAHYRFGARTGLSLIFGGIILFLIAIICTDSAILSALPKGMFGILLIAVSIELGKHGIKTGSIPITAMIAVLSIPFGLAVGFFVGLITVWSYDYYKRMSDRTV